MGKMGLEERIELDYITALRGGASVLFGYFSYRLGEESLAAFERASQREWFEGAGANYIIPGFAAFSSIVLGAAAISTLGRIGYKAYKNRKK